MCDEKYWSEKIRGDSQAAVGVGLSGWGLTGLDFFQVSSNGKKVRYCF